MRRLCVLLALVPILGLAQDQESAKRDVWEPFRCLIGQWEGTGSGMSGTSSITSEFTLVLGDQFIDVHNRAVFEPQEANPDGEIHEDRGFISFDKGRQTYVFRQFHVEGFVNQYVLDTVSADGRRLVFMSENLENAPPAMRARLIIEMTGDDACRTAFELAFPGKEFSCFSQNELKRKN